MPGPPPPPPPGGPPPPMMPAFTPPKGGSDGHSALLNSIQKGTKLKKATTNDKSAPMIGKASKLTNSSTSSNANSFETSRSGSNNTANGAPMNLGSLFAAGIPKLKSTGMRALESPSSGGNGSSTSNQNSIPKSSTPPTSTSNLKSNIQNELKQIANSTRTRGPPPPAPTRNLNCSEPHLNRNGSTVNGLSLPAPLTGTGMGANGPPAPNISSLHRNAQSNLNLSTWNDSSRDGTDGSSVTSRPSHGKPNLAPRPPPQTNGKLSNLNSSSISSSANSFETSRSGNNNTANEVPTGMSALFPAGIPKLKSTGMRQAAEPVVPPKKVLNGKTNASSVHRAQSMRNSSNRQPTTPDSPDSATASTPPPKFGTVRHMPTSVAGGGLSHARSRPSLNGRPPDPPPSVPVLPPLPPPPSGVAGSPTTVPHHHRESSRHGTPPPPSRTQGSGFGQVVSQLQRGAGHNTTQAPSMPPPPPPPKTLRQPPPPPVPAPSSLSTVAPPPPPRNSSMRERAFGSCSGDFESRFGFHSTSEFPRPSSFKSMPKDYRGKSGPRW